MQLQVVVFMLGLHATPQHNAAPWLAGLEADKFSCTITQLPTHLLCMMIHSALLQPLVVPESNTPALSTTTPPYVLLLLQTTRGGGWWLTVQACTPGLPAAAAGKAGHHAQTHRVGLG
jgi:hypothetical protein